MIQDISKELQLFTILILPAVLGLFFRPLIFGFDSYATINGICFGNWSALSSQPLTNFIFSFFPCSFLFFKVFMFLSLIITLYIIMKIVGLYFSDMSLFSLFFLIGLSPIMLFEFAKFENELFAYPLIVFGIYLLLKREFVWSLVVFLVSIFFWVWPYYLTFFPSNSLVLELRPFGGLSSLFLLVFFVPFIFLVKNKKVIGLSVVSLGLFLWNAKFFIFLMPFIAISIGLVLEKLHNKKEYINTAWLVCFILIFSVNLSLFMQEPQQIQFDLLSKGIEFAEKEDLPIYNDWSYGHWIEYLGYETKYKSGGHNPDYNLLEKPFVGLTDSNLLHLGCKFVSNARNLKLWVCK